jgi:hypothetical protein
MTTLFQNASDDGLTYGQRDEIIMNSLPISEADRTLLRKFFENPLEFITTVRTLPDKEQRHIKHITELYKQALETEYEIYSRKRREQLKFDRKNSKKT